MTPALNQSGFAPPGVVEVELGTLRVGQRFRSWYNTRYDDGVVLMVGQCSVLVKLEGTEQTVEFEVTNADGEKVPQTRTLPARKEHWSVLTPVEYLPDTAACPESEQEETNEETENE